MVHFVYGKIVIDVDIDIKDACSEEEAKEKAIEILNSYFHLDVNGSGIHDPESVDYPDLVVGEYDEDE